MKLMQVHLLFVGSYYYHNTEPGMNYEETILGVYKYANQTGIPYRWVDMLWHGGQTYWQVHLYFLSS